MKIIITGAGGMLGYDLWQVLSMQNELYGLGRSECPDFVKKEKWLQVDLTDPGATYQVMTKVNPELVIHTAALTDVDACELNPEKAYLVNTLATRNVALACQRFDTVMLYISTDYVFAGEKDTPYREDDLPNPINIYGKTKYNGEFYVCHLLNKFYVVRTAWLFGKRKKNFVTEILRKIRENSGSVNSPSRAKSRDAKSAELKIVADQIGSPTYTKDLAITINELITKNLYGLYHLTNADSASRYQMALEIANFFGYKRGDHLKILPINQMELNRPAKRPKYSVLDNYNWRTQGFKPLRDWKEALKEYLSD